MSPQEYLDDIMKSRGYSTKRYNTLKTAYHNKPTPLQRASYDLHLIGLVKQNRPDILNEIFQSGISPNPCNVYGESLLHMVCRRGEYHILKVMLDNKCNVQVADDYGRTPLHDACWASEPATETVELLLKEDISLMLMTDCRGFLPLSYVRKEHWEQWINFLDTHKDTYWPPIEVFTRDANGKKERVKITTDLVTQNPDSRPLPDPTNALPLDLASMVASGTIRPEEAAYLRKRREKGLDDDDTTEEDDDDETSAFGEEDATDICGDSTEDSDSSDDSSTDDDEALLADLPLSGFRVQ
jgi:ankyrin repeat protein